MTPRDEDLCLECAYYPAEPGEMLCDRCLDAYTHRPRREGPMATGPGRLRRVEVVARL